jgi:hypothetical protein
MIPVNATVKEVIENHLGLDYEKQEFLLSKIYAIESDINDDIAGELAKDINILSEKLSLLIAELTTPKALTLAADLQEAIKNLKIEKVGLL